MTSSKLVLSILLLFSADSVGGFAPQTNRMLPIASGRLNVRRPSDHFSRELCLPRQAIVVSFPLTTTSRPMEENDDGDNSKAFSGSLFQKAKQKFKARPGTYLMIPVIAALVGWFTNYLAVQMIFYPIQFWGIPIWRRPEVPLGFLGWQHCSVQDQDHVAGFGHYGHY
jgi:hypothetical protein